MLTLEIQDVWKVNVNRLRKAETLIYERRIRAPKVENTMELFLFLRINNINNNIKTEQMSVTHD